MKELAEEIEALSAVRFKFIAATDKSYSDYYESESSNILIELMDASGFVNDRDMLFEDYQYVLGISALKTGDYSKNERVRDSLARAMFINLKSTRRYALMMVFNMGEKLDQFDPS